MHDLTQFSLRDITECCMAFREMERGARAMEEIAQRAVRYLYSQFTAGPGANAWALVRLFKTQRFGDLDASLQAAAQQSAAGQALSEDTKCLVLLATDGEKEEWQSRHRSRGHKAIPLPSPEIVQAFPMISSLVRQLGIDVRDLLEPKPALLLDMAQKSYNVFCVPKAPGSPFIPAQAEFIIPFQIASVLGFGGMLPSGDLFAMILFAKAPVSQEAAEMFKPLALSLKVALLSMDETFLEDGGAEHGRP